MTIASDSVDPWQKVRQQFDCAPYPRVPLDRSPKLELEKLYIHNLSTAFYLRNQTVVSTEGKVILDAGCGSGYKSLIINLVKHWQQLRPLNPITLTPSHPQDAFRIVQQMVQYLESFGYLMIELHD